MNNLLIITPVKDSIDTAIRSISTTCAHKGKDKFLVYNDFSSLLSKNILEQETHLGFELINIEDFVLTPSPNYRFTLIDARKKAIELNTDLLIIESDVFVKPETISSLKQFALQLNKCGMVAAITVDENGKINFPYKHIIPTNSDFQETKHRLSFCCTLLTNALLQKLDLEKLSIKKHWFDVQVSKDSRSLGFKNYIITSEKVIHLPHSSRPWKLLKYSNPVKYYLRKFIFNFDRI